MKKWMPTLVAVVLCVGGFWYAASQDFFREQSAEDVPLLKVEADQITSFTLKQAKEEVKLVKDNENWKMELPQAYPINQYGVDNWINNFVELSLQSLVEEQAADLEKYGLSSPSASYEVTLKDGKTIQLDIGDAAPIAGEVYARLGGSEAGGGNVYALDEYEVASLNKDVLNFTANEPFEFVSDQVTDFEWSMNEKSYSAVKLKAGEEQAKSADQTGQSEQAESSDQSKGTEQSDSLKWKINKKELEATDVLAWLNDLRFQSATELPRLASEVVKGKEVMSLSITMDKLDGSSMSDIQSKQYKGYLVEDNVWIVPEGSEWAIAIPKEKLDDLQHSLDELLKKDVQPQQSDTEADKG
ncbi:DUF4340 domain-containing protein [Paenibacillus marinisediminis]